MANICSFEMKINGSKESRNMWLQLMKKKDIPNHFFRIEECEVYMEEEDSYYIFGCCAWSIASCCLDVGYSEGTDLLAVNTENLNLEVEIWSVEEGLGFQEHFIYKNGECIVDEIKEDYSSIYLDSYNSIEELNDECGTNYTEDDFDEGYLEIGGFDNYGEWHI